jgi:multidrug transporter EmrE-like cation transporter
MYLVLFSGLASALFGSGYKIATIIKARRAAVNASMMLCTAALAAVLARPEGGIHLDHPVAAFGATAGLCLFLTTTAFFQVMRYGRLAIQWTVINMAIALPTAVSIVFWGDRPTPLVMTGMVLTALALVLMGVDKGANVLQDDGGGRFNPARGAGDRARWFGLVVFSFFTTGLVQVCNKAAVHYHGAGSKMTYVFACHAVAGVLATGMLVFRRVVPRRRDVALGAFMALGLLAGMGFLLVALHRTPGIVVYPLRTVYAIVFTTVLSLTLWRERVHAPGVVGILVAVAAIYCLSRG